MMHAGEHGQGLGALVTTARGHLHGLINAEHGLGMLQGFKFPTEFVKFGEGHGRAAFVIGTGQSVCARAAAVSMAKLTSGSGER